MSTRIPWAEVGRCSCGATVYPDAFRDIASLDDYRITNFCQSCQDDIYFRVSDSGPGWRYPIRRGVLAAALNGSGVHVELGLLPFISVIPDARVAWEARYLLRAGVALAPLNPWDELVPLKPALDTHQVCLTEVCDVRGPEVRAAFDVDLVVVLDAAARDSLASLPVATSALCLALADELPWQTLYGAPLPALLTAWAGGVEGASVLRLCALLGLALEPMGGGAFEPLRWLVAPHRHRFPEFSWSRPDDSP